MIQVACYYETLVCIYHTTHSTSEGCVYLYVEMWDLEVGRKDIDSIHGRFCKTILRILRSAANQIGELKLGRDNKNVCVIVKCQLCSLHISV